MNLANAALWQKAVNNLYAVVAVDSVQRSLPPLHSFFVSHLLYYTALWSIKLSFLLFFRKLGIDIRRHMILWYCVLGYTVASYVICLGTIDYKCFVEPGGLGNCPSSRGKRVLIIVHSGMSKRPRLSLYAYLSRTRYRIRHYNRCP